MWPPQDPESEKMGTRKETAAGVAAAAVATCQISPLALYVAVPANSTAKSQLRQFTR